jgi:hypothetical protein
VRTEVPEHVNVALKWTEIDTYCVNIGDAPQITAVDNRMHMLDSAGKEKCMVHHKHAVTALRELHQVSRIIGTCAHRLLNKNVLALFKREARNSVMSSNWRGDNYRVDSRQSDDSFGRL